MNARRINAAAGVVLAAQKQRNTATGIAAALEAAGLLQSPESASSPWERAVAGLNALVDAGVAFHVEPDGHISTPFSDEHIEWDLKAKRWVLTHDEDEGLPPLEVSPDQARRIEHQRPETNTAHDCNLPLVRRLDCGHCPHEVCQDCDRCPHTCRCAEDPHDSPLHQSYALGHDLPEKVTA